MLWPLHKFLTSPVLQPVTAFQGLPTTPQKWNSLPASIPTFGMRKRHKFYETGRLTDLSSRKQAQLHFQIEAYRYECFNHFSNVIQIWFCWLGMWYHTCHIYWLEHWAEAWFLSLLSKIYLHLALKVMQIKYRKTSWESGILIFPLVEMVQATTLSNKTPFSVHFVQCAWYFSPWSQRWCQTITWNGVLLICSKPVG